MSDIAKIAQLTLDIAKPPSPLTIDAISEESIKHITSFFTRVMKEHE